MNVRAQAVFGQLMSAASSSLDIGPGAGLTLTSLGGPPHYFSSGAVLRGQGSLSITRGANFSDGLGSVRRLRLTESASVRLGQTSTVDELEVIDSAFVSADGAQLFARSVVSTVVPSSRAICVSAQPTSLVLVDSVGVLISLCRPPRAGAAVVVALDSSAPSVAAPSVAAIKFTPENSSAPVVVMLNRTGPSGWQNFSLAVCTQCATALGSTTDEAYAQLQPAPVGFLAFGEPFSAADGNVSVWNSASSGSWTDASRWSPPRVPAAGAKVYIPSLSAITVTLSGAAVNVSSIIIGAVGYAGDGPTLIVSTDVTAPIVHVRKGAVLQFSWYTTLRVNSLTVDGTLSQTYGRVTLQNASTSGTQRLAVTSTGRAFVVGHWVLALNASTESGGLWELGAGSSLELSAGAALENLGTIRLLAASGIRGDGRIFNRGVFETACSEACPATRDCVLDANVQGVAIINTATMSITGPRHRLTVYSATLRLDSDSGLLGQGTLVMQYAGLVLAPETFLNFSGSLQGYQVTITCDTDCFLRPPTIALGRSWLVGAGNITVTGSVQLGDYSEVRASSGSFAVAVGAELIISSIVYIRRSAEVQGRLVLQNGQLQITPPYAVRVSGSAALLSSGNSYVTSEGFSMGQCLVVEGLLSIASSARLELQCPIVLPPTLRLRLTPALLGTQPTSLVLSSDVALRPGVQLQGAGNINTAYGTLFVEESVSLDLANFTFVAGAIGGGWACGCLKRCLHSGKT